MIVIDGGVVARLGSATAVVLYGSVRVDERREGLGRLVTENARTVLVCVEVEPGEDGLVEDASGLFAREAVELVWSSEEIEQHVQGCAAGVEVGPLGLVELVLEAGAFVADASEPFGDFFLGPVGVAHEIEILIFLVVELGELLFDLVASPGVDVLVVCHRVVDGFGDPGA